MSSSPMTPAVAHAVCFITSPLYEHSLYSTTTIDNLQLALYNQMTAAVTAGRRHFTLSPWAVPPKPIYAACASSGVQWAQWIILLTDREADLVIHPGRVTIHVGAQTTVVWQDQVRKPWLSGVPQITVTPQKTLAQLVIEADEEDEEELFAMLSTRLSVPIVSPTPTRETFTISSTVPPVPRIPSPFSRSSSRSSSSSGSDASSTFSTSLSETSSCSSTDLASSMPAVDSVQKPRVSRSVISRRERARLARVFIDKSKAAPTNYDGGKTSVLTGGVMLGGRPTLANKTNKASVRPPTSAIAKPTPATTTSWRRC